MLKDYFEIYYRRYIWIYLFAKPFWLTMLTIKPLFNAHPNNELFLTRY